MKIFSVRRELWIVNRRLRVPTRNTPASSRISWYSSLGSAQESVGPQNVVISSVMLRVTWDDDRPSIQMFFVYPVKISVSGKSCAAYCLVTSAKVRVVSFASHGAPGSIVNSAIRPHDLLNTKGLFSVQAVQLLGAPPKVLRTIVLRIVIHMVHALERQRARVEHPRERDQPVDVVARPAALQIIELCVPVVSFQEVRTCLVVEPLPALRDVHRRMLSAIPQDHAERGIREGPTLAVDEFAGFHRYFVHSNRL